jgi:rare lipoprotein A (peptidoglycan hydrolase)
MKKSQTHSNRGGWRHVAIWSAIVLVLIAPVGCKRRKTDKKPIAAAPSGPIQAEPLPARAPDPPLVTNTAAPAKSHRGRLVYATWYEVPPESLAARRAAPDEYTAAHNHLPIGTQVRVTDPNTGKSVIVRITDRGIPRHASQIDLCKRAAQELGIVRAGRVRMRMEVLPDDKKLGALTDTHSAAPHP